MTEWTQNKPDAPGEYWAVINWVVTKVRVDFVVGNMLVKSADGTYYVRNHPIRPDKIAYWCQSDVKPKMPKAGWANA